MRITKYEVRDPRITRDYKIVMLSDLHNKHYKSIVRKVKKEDPEVILIVGDLVDRHRRTYRRVKPFLKAISKAGICFFSFGNHEVKFPKITGTDINECGVRVLDDEYIRYADLAIGGQTSMAGMEDPHPERPTHQQWLKTASLDWLPALEQDDGFRILLCHHPEYYEQYNLKDRDLDLILAGHAHGGQMRLFGHAVYAPGQGLWPKYTHGVYGNMIVGAGLINTIKPIAPRLGNPTEIVELYLRPGKEPQIKELS